MKRIALLIGLVCAVGFLLSTTAHALPTLLVNEVSKMKYTNYENVYDMNNDGFINTGDYAEGIAVLTGIYNVSDSVTAWLPDAGEELTMHFKLHVKSASGTPIPTAGFVGSGLAGNLEFELLSGDFLRAYYDDTPDWEPGHAGGLASAIATANDGDLYFSTEATEYFYGINATTQTTSVNDFWANMTVNATGYEILPMSYPSTAGIGIPGHEYTSDYFLESKLRHNIDPNIPVFMFRSEDPLYVTAVPEPATMLLLGSGLIGLAGLVRKKRKNLTTV